MLINFLQALFAADINFLQVFYLPYTNFLQQNAAKVQLFFEICKYFLIFLRIWQGNVLNYAKHTLSFSVSDWSLAGFCFLSLARLINFHWIDG